ncbi:MAG: trimethylamine methyltransferase family protein [Paracoccaceae bacterium]
MQAAGNRRYRTLAGLSGLNMVYESVGMHASLLGFSLEPDAGDDMLGQVLRCVRGIDDRGHRRASTRMRQVCIRPGALPWSDQTLKLMQTEYVYPVGNRMSPKEWGEAGRPMLLDGARKRTDDILRKAPCQIDAALDASIRQKFAIYFR